MPIGCPFHVDDGSLQADSQPKLVGCHLVLSVHLSTEPSELSQWSCHDSTTNIGIIIIILIIPLVVKIPRVKKINLAEWLEVRSVDWEGIMQKHGVKTLNRDRDSLRAEQNLCHHLKYERFCDLGLSESPTLLNGPRFSTDTGWKTYCALRSTYLTVFLSAAWSWHCLAGVNGVGCPANHCEIWSDWLKNGHQLYDSLLIISSECYFVNVIWPRVLQYYVLSLVVYNLQSSILPDQQNL